MSASSGRTSRALIASALCAGALLSVPALAAASGDALSESVAESAQTAHTVSLLCYTRILHGGGTYGQIFLSCNPDTTAP